MDYNYRCGVIIEMNARQFIDAHRFWGVASFIAILHIVLFDLRIITAAETLQVQYIPDDAFYYLTLSRNFATMGMWTFDSGISTATGFHPLLAYLLALLYKTVQPAPEAFVQYGLVLSSLLTLTTLLIIWALGLRQSKPYFLMILTLLISSKNYTYNSISITEWPLVVLFASLYVLYFYYSYYTVSRNSFLVLFTLGLLGSLARSDFGLLPFALFAASLLVMRFTRHRRAILMSFAGLVGAGLGVVLIFVHNYIFSGHILQSSARMKAYLAQVYGVAYMPTVRLIADLLTGVVRNVTGGYGLPALIALLFTILAVFVILKSRNMAGSHSGAGLSLGIDGRLRELTLVTAAGLCIMGCIFIYAHNAGIQPWYSANLVVPIFVLLVTVLCYFDSAIQHHYRKLIEVAVSFIVIGIITGNLVAIHYNLANSRWPHQQIMLAAGRYLSQQTLDGNIASWNAGIIGYYQGGNVINIDGLVNDDIYPYVVNNALPTYLLYHDVNYIIDFQNMLNEPDRRLAGGYNSEAFRNSLQPVKVFDEGQYRWQHLTLYRLSPSTIAVATRQACK